MTSEITRMNAEIRRDLEAQLVARAWEDDAFKAELLADPKGVIEREARLQHPGLLQFLDGLQVHLNQETPSDLHIVLPFKPEMSAERELSDADLQLVAGASAESGYPPVDLGALGACGGAGGLAWRR